MIYTSNCILSKVVSSKKMSFAVRLLSSTVPSKSGARLAADGIPPRSSPFSPSPSPSPKFPPLKTRLRVIKRVFISADRKTSSNSSSTDLVFRPHWIHSIAGLRTRRARARNSQARTVSQRGTCSFRRASPVISGFVRRRVDGNVEMRNWGYRCCRACVFLLYFFVIASKNPRFSRPAWSSSEFR